jgi:hypothetical protein
MVEMNFDKPEKIDKSPRSAYGGRAPLEQICFCRMSGKGGQGGFVFFHCKSQKFLKVVYFFLFVFFSTWPISANAETIYLKNGRTFQGEITGRDEQNTYIRLYAGANLILSNEDIVKPSPTPETTPTEKDLEEKPAEPATSTPIPERRTPRLIIFRPQDGRLPPSPTPTSTPSPVRVADKVQVEVRRVHKQPLRTLLARRFVYHTVVENDPDYEETKEYFLKKLGQYRQEEVWADAIEIRLYGVNENGLQYEWPFASATWAPGGEWSKARANTPHNQFKIRIKYFDKVEDVKP